MISAGPGRSGPVAEIEEIDRLERASRKVGILIAVQPPPLLRIVEHLLRDCTQFRVVARTSQSSTLKRQAKRLQPALIITNLRLLGPGAGRIIPEIRLASPGSQLLVTGFTQGLESHARDCGADAYLEEDQLVQRLVSAARKLLSKPQTRSHVRFSVSASAGPGKGQRPLRNPGRGGRAGTSLGGKKR
jgi:DNA-binding NarL/FixJ family response regulator